MTGRGLRRCLAVGLLGLVGGVALVGQGEAVKDSHAGVFRPGGMAPRDTRRALAHDARRLLAGRNDAHLERFLDRITGSATPSEPRWSPASSISLGCPADGVRRRDPLPRGAVTRIVA